MYLKKYSKIISISIFTISLLSFLAVTNSAFAGEIYHAPVVKSVPIYGTVPVNTPTERCYDVRRPQRTTSYNSYTSRISGGIIGGAIGNEIGSGRGRHAAQAAGVLLGGSIGRDYEHRRKNRQVVTQECERVNNVTYENVVTGYDVTYQYDGRLYSTQMQNRPSSTIPVRVGVVPVQ